jgi:hypothetical protein
MTKQKTIPMSAVKSSQIESIGHEGGTLAVKFKNGGEYHFQDVNAEEFQKLKSAESVGSYFGKHIKGIFKFTKVSS